MKDEELILYKYENDNKKISDKIITGDFYEKNF